VTFADAIVVVLGVALIVGELWFFLGPRKPRAVTAPPGALQEIRVLVKGGYDPDTITVEAGRPVRLLFYRDEEDECSERLIFEHFKIERELPAFETTSIEFTPPEPGDYPFHCGLSVMRGRVVAQVGRESARANLGKGHSKHG
jgi:Cu+-exporting ATPase